MEPLPTSLGSPLTSPSHVRLASYSMNMLFLLPVTLCLSFQLQLAWPWVSHASGGILGPEMFSKPLSLGYMSLLCALLNLVLPLYWKLYESRDSVSLTHYNFQYLPPDIVTEKRKKKGREKCWKEEKIIVFIKILKTDCFWIASKIV